MALNIPENVQALIQGDYLKEALDEYLRYATNIDDDKLKNRLIYFHSQLADIEKKFSFGAISHSEYDVIKNKIRLGILKIEETPIKKWNVNFEENREIISRLIGITCLMAAMTRSHFLGLTIWIQYFVIALMVIMGVTSFYSLENLIIKQLLGAFLVIFLIAIILKSFF